MAYFAFDLNEVDPRTITRSARDVLTWRCPECHFTWPQSVNQRSQASDPLGCENCNPKRRSKREMRLEAELQWIFPNEMPGESRRIRIGRKHFECDIVLREIGVIVEYDGCYWHANRLRFDRQKTQTLAGEGWTVIRVRETPLPKTQEHDVAIAPDTPVKALTDAVVMAISDTTGVLTPRMERYLSAKRAKAADVAEGLIRSALRIHGNAPS